MQTGQLTIGTMILSETNVVQDSLGSNVDERVLQLVGRESSCDSPVDVMKSNIMGLQDKIVPVQFQYKNSYDGYYRVTNANVDYDKWYNGSTLIQWTLTLQRLGPDNAVDLESRLANVMRNNLVGERWHAPSAGHTTYFTGSTVGTKLVRTSADGPVTVYRGIPASINPLWSCPVTGYSSGRSRFIQDGFERLATRFQAGVLGWELSNGLVRVKPVPSSGTLSTFLVAVYSNGVWNEKAWDVQIAATALRPSVDFRSITVLRNDPEAVSIRVLAANPVNGNRVLIDLVLRRGSRFVEGYVQRTTSGDIVVCLDTSEGSWTDFGMYAALAGRDSNGDRWAAGSSKAWSLAANGGVFLSAATTLDFWIGAEVPKPADVGGDPGFETGSPASWSATGGVLTTVSGGAKHGTYFGRLTATGGTEARIEMGYDAPAVVGRSYTITGWLRSPVSLTAGAAMLRLRWYNGATPLSTADVAAPALSANVWTPVTGSAVAPASTTLVGRQAALVGTPTAGAVLDIDSVYTRETTDSGDTAAVLQDQYIGAMAEKVGVVRR